MPTLIHGTLLTLCATSRRGAWTQRNIVSRKVFPYLQWSISTIRDRENSLDRYRSIIFCVAMLVNCLEWWWYCKLCERLCLGRGWVSRVGLIVSSGDSFLQKETSWKTKKGDAQVDSTENIQNTIRTLINYATTQTGPHVHTALQCTMWHWNVMVLRGKMWEASCDKFGICLE